MRSYAPNRLKYGKMCRKDLLLKYENKENRYRKCVSKSTLKISRIACKTAVKLL